MSQAKRTVQYREEVERLKALWQPLDANDYLDVITTWRAGPNRNLPLDLTTTPKFRKQFKLDGYRNQLTTAYEEDGDQSDHDDAQADLAAPAPSRRSAPQALRPTPSITRSTRSKASANSSPPLLVNPSRSRRLGISSLMRGMSKLSSSSPRPKTPPNNPNSDSVQNADWSSEKQFGHQTARFYTAALYAKNGLLKCPFTGALDVDASHMADHAMPEAPRRACQYAIGGYWPRCSRMNYFFRTCFLLFLFFYAYYPRFSRPPDPSTCR